jgi:hypothetical protein
MTLKKKIKAQKKDKTLRKASKKGKIAQNVGKCPKR